MAITITRQKDGKMKVTKRTGFDAVAFKFGNALEAIKSGAKRAVTAPARANARYRKAQAAKELDDVRRGFGTVRRYVEFNPSYKKRADYLRKISGQ